MGSPFTAQQVAQIVSTPLGRDAFITDELVLVERKKISEKYSELKSTKRWFSVTEFKRTGNLWALNQYPEGADLLPDYTEASIEARAWWLTENVL